MNIDDRKKLVSRLFECQKCHLKFRHPKDDGQRSFKYYTNEYAESDGITTTLPNKADLEKLVNTNFGDTPKNADRYIELMRFLKPNGDIRVLDFGANWGYTSYQFQKAGIDVVPYEISVPRAQYGMDNLGLNIVTDIDKIDGQFDFVFSAHVIEHLPNINILFDLAKKLTKKGGFLLTFCPNGSLSYKAANPIGYHKCWGHIHPNYISEDFFKTEFAKNAYFIGSGDNLDRVQNWDQNSQIVDDMSEWELFSIVRL